MILKFKQGASQHGFSNPAEAYAAGCSFAVLAGNGLPIQVGLPFETDGRRGVSFIHASDLWKVRDIGEIDCIFIDSRPDVSNDRLDLPPNPQVLFHALDRARDAMIEVRQSVRVSGPADRGAAMVIAAIDGFGAFLKASEDRMPLTT